MPRGTGARRRRSQRRGRVVRPGVGKAPAQDDLTASGLEESPAADQVDPDVKRAFSLLSQEPGLVDPGVLAVAAAIWQAAEDKEEELAAQANCAACEHAYTAHLGDEGPCTVEGCDCNGYEAPTDVDDGGGSSISAEALESTADTLPDAHQPGERLPRLRPGPQPIAPEAANRTNQWSSIFAPEAKLTSDGRAFAPGSIWWRETPLTLMAMTETSEGGHVGAKVAGRIDDVYRTAPDNLIRGVGVFDTNDYGKMIAGMVGDETLRGVSVDMAVHDYEVGPRSDFFDADGNWAPNPDRAGKEPSLIDILLGEEDSDDPMIRVATNAELGMVTVCPFAAFAEARIAIGDSLVASGEHPELWTITQQAGFTVIASAALVAAIPPDANYRPEETEGQSCGTCSYFEDGRCSMYDNTPVEDDHVCDDWTDEPVEASASADCGCQEESEGPIVTDEIAEPITAAAAGITPEAPPAEWFNDPELEELTPLTIDDDGRVYGHAAAWGVCHMGMPGTCRTAPHSQSDYQYFHLGEVLCEGGERLPVGQITLNTGHAGAGRAAETTAHYDHTGTVGAYVRCGEDKYGIWVAGALRSDVAASTVESLRGAKLSGDWRKVDGKTGLELVALLAVNVPGFPVPRPHAGLTASIEGEEVTSLTAAGIPIFEADLTAEELERLAALREHGKFSELAGQAAA